MSRFFAVLALVASCLSCGIPALRSPSSVGMEEDETVALADEEGNIYCSGTWVGPTKILTAGHCVAETGAGEKVYFLNKGDLIGHEGKVVAWDSLHDLGLIEAAVELPHPVATLGAVPSDGDNVTCVGHALGFGWSYQTGVVSSVRPPQEGASEGSFFATVQTDTAIQPGDSGAALFNANGQIVGVISYTAGNRGGVSFAVHPDHIKEFLVQN